MYKVTIQLSINYHHVLGTTYKPSPGSITQLLLLVLVEEHSLKVHVGPSMPSLVPVGVVVCSCGIILQHSRDGVLIDPLQTLLPLAQLQVTPIHNSSFRHNKYYSICHLWVYIKLSILVDKMEFE